MRNLSQIRWLSSQQRTLLALEKNLIVIDMYLESVAAENVNKISTNVKGTLKNFAPGFIKTLHYWLDVLEILAVLSKKFQTDEFTVLDINIA